MTDTSLIEVVEQARAAVLAERDRLGEIQRARSVADAEVVALEERSGADVLADLAQAEVVADEMTRLAGRVRLLGRAVEAQQPRIMAAEARYLTAEADAAEPAAVEAEAAVAAHDRTTQRLLNQLEQHEGPYVSQEEHVQTKVQLGVHPIGLSWQQPKSARLRAEATIARRRVEVLRQLAAGDDPEPMVLGWGLTPGEVYPACVRGPEALVATPAFLRSVAAARKRVADLEAAQRDFPAEIAALNVTADLHAPYDDPRLPVFRRVERLAELPAELEQARADLAVLEPA